MESPLLEFSKVHTKENAFDKINSEIDTENIFSEFPAAGLTKSVDIGEEETNYYFPSEASNEGELVTGEVDQELEEEINYLIERNRERENNLIALNNELEFFVPEADPILFYEDVKLRCGETLIGLAAEYGFDPDDWLEIWNDPKNAALKAKRKLSSNVREGDTIFFPIKWRITSQKKLIPFGNRFLMKADRSGKEGARVDWVQTVFAHNQPNFPEKPFPDFSVDIPTEDDLPFYWTQENYDHLTKNAAGNVIRIFRKSITDIPNRPAPTVAQGTTTWRAVTSLCLNTHKRISIWNTFVWGVNFNPDGTNTAYEIRNATQEEINGHMNLLRRKTGKSKRTFTNMGWTFRDRNS